MRRLSIAAVPVPLLLGTTMFFWGAAFNVTASAFELTTPGFVAFSRALVGGIVLVALLPVLGGRLPRDRRLLLLAAICGIGGTTLSLGGMSEGTAKAGPAVASVLLNTAPFFVAIMARFALHERITLLRGAGLVVGFCGVVLIVLGGGGDVTGGTDLVIGCLLTLLGAIGYGGSSVIVRWMHLRGIEYELYGFTAAQFLWGALFLLPYALFVGDLGSTQWDSGKLWLDVAFLALGAQLLAYVTFYAALQRWASARVFVWAFLPPVIANVIAIVQGEVPPALTLAGMVVVLAAVAIVALPRAESAPEEADPAPAPAPPPSREAPVP